jgi:predicted TIM-barrel fold metal-dependent hydrolase
MRIVDFHTHLFSRPYFDALAALSPLPGGPEALLADLGRKTGIEIPVPELAPHVARWLAALSQHGVERAASFASLPAEVEAVAEAARLSGGKLVPMALVDPLANGAAERTRWLLNERGYKGLLVFPAMHHFRIGGSELRACLEVLAERRAVLYVHCGLLVVKLRELLGLPRAVDLAYANPLDIVPVAQAFPGVAFVIPHFGAGFFRETLLAGAQCENVYVDTSSSHSWMRTQPARMDLREVFARALDVFGPRRILFGTDSGTFPAGFRAERLTEQRAVLEALGLPPSDRAAILGENAARLLEAP